MTTKFVQRIEHTMNGKTHQNGDMKSPLLSHSTDSVSVSAAINSKSWQIKDGFYNFHLIGAKKDDIRIDIY